MINSNSVKNKLRKIEQEIAKISRQEKRRQQDLIRYQKKRTRGHRRTKKRMAEVQKNVNRGTRKNRPVLKASSSPVDEPYTMEQDIIDKYLEQNINLQNIKQALDQTSQRMIQMENQPIRQNMSSSQLNKRSDQRKSMKDTHTKNLKHFTKLTDQLDEPLGIIKEIYPGALQDHIIIERYDPQYAVPSNFTGSPAISEGEFDSLSPPNYMEDMPSLTGLKLTGDELANMERGNEMSLVRQIRDSQAMPAPSSDGREHKSNEGVTDIERARQEAEFAEQEAEIAKEEAILAQEEAITQQMLRDTGLRITSQDERDIAEELEEMERGAGRNRKRHTRRKHKRKKKKTYKKKKTHKKKKKRRKKKGGTGKKKGGTRKKKGGTRKNRRR
jgi:hypothetical protein